MNFYEALEKRVDWDLVNKHFRDENDAMSTLREDYNSYTWDEDTGNEYWEFSKWLKKEKINLDKTLKMLKL